MELDKKYIISLVQDILDKAHRPGPKRHIRVYDDRLTFACPICGDSQKSDTKKRGNLYFKNMYYVCYNDDSCSRTFTRFLKTFGLDMDLDKKMELYEYLEQNVSYKEADNAELSQLDKLFDLDDVVAFFQTDYTRGLTGLKPLQKGSVVYNHVTRVRRLPFTRDIYEGVFHITKKWKQPVMVYLNRHNDKVISLQVRNLLSGEKRMFKIFDFSMLYDMMFPEGELDPQERISYNKLSHFFNIFNVDFSQPVTLFEGFTDSLFIRNSIGQIGVNTDLTFLLKEEGVDFRFVYDNDEAGFKKAKSMLEDGYSVFLWNKFFVDLAKTYKGKRPALEFVRMLKNIKDFNNLAKKFKEPIEKLFNFAEYFSNDDLDRYYFMDLEQVYKTEGI